MFSIVVPYFVGTFYFPLSFSFFFLKLTLHDRMWWSEFIKSKSKKKIKISLRTHIWFDVGGSTYLNMFTTGEYLLRQVLLASHIFLIGNRAFQPPKNCVCFFLNKFLHKHVRPTVKWRNDDLKRIWLSVYRICLNKILALISSARSFFKLFLMYTHVQQNKIIY